VKHEGAANLKAQLEIAIGFDSARRDFESCNSIQDISLLSKNDPGHDNRKKTGPGRLSSIWQERIFAIGRHSRKPTMITFLLHASSFAGTLVC
jgi:hypothetical protein